MLDIYPDLKNHPDVHGRPEIDGITSPVLFINHQEPEESHEGTRSKQNPFEAEYIVSMCHYLKRQNYQSSQITIITMYVGQLLYIRNLMPKHEFEGVKITSVDNFQGEENDIILLSLVRSNSEGNLGFVSIENRICVALSRARNGLYVIGNITMLKESKSVMWQKIISKAEKAGYVVKDIPVRCGPHGCEQLISKPQDFKEKTPQGGCWVKCDEIMECTHQCPQYCHAFDREHTEFKCLSPCIQIFEPCGHPCPDKCYVKCSPCMVDKPVIMPTCGHDQVIRCHQSEDEVDCLHPCEVYCERCLKTKQVPCKDYDGYVCDTPCLKDLPCKHKCQGSCGRCLTGCIKCCNMCGKVHDCGHRCEKVCCYPDKCSPCQSECLLKCGHGNRCNRPCSEHSQSQCKFDCTNDQGENRCYRRRKCSHVCRDRNISFSYCQKFCNEPCSFDPCVEYCANKFYKTLPRCEKCKKNMGCFGVCGHSGNCFGFCKVCNKEGYDYYYQGGSQVILENCGHRWPIKELGAHLDNDNSRQQREGQRRIALCPTLNCSKVILEAHYWKYNCPPEENCIYREVRRYQPKTSPFYKPKPLPYFARQDLL